jgi:transcriptional regulator with XRE-family HTH domain
MQDDKEVLMQFGAHLKKLREDRGLSLRQLSYNCKVDYSKIAQMEKGLINPTLITIIELAKGLEVVQSDLLKF